MPIVWAWFNMAVIRNMRRLLSSSHDSDLSMDFAIRKIAVCFLWLSLPGDYRVTDEALLAETT